jgi:hypothetical protein
VIAVDPPAAVVLVEAAVVVVSSIPFSMTTLS